MDRHQFINLTTVGPEQLMANCVRKTRVEKSQRLDTPSNSNVNGTVDTSSVWTVCESAREFESYRERWWYIAVSNCDTKKGLRLKYSFEMTNEGGNSWVRHFSADQFYILHTDVGFTVLYYLLFLASAFTASEYTVAVSSVTPLTVHVCVCLSLFLTRQELSNAAIYCMKRTNCSWSLFY